MRPEEVRVQEALVELGFDSEVMVFAQTTHTAEEAAAAAGCELGQIVKTLAFDVDGSLLLVLIGGGRQVDTAKLAPFLGVPRKRIRMMSPDTVLELTGYPVGGVPPVGHYARREALLDAALLEYELVYCAAGSANAIFPIKPPQLVAATGARSVDLTRSASGAETGTAAAED